MTDRIQLQLVGRPADAVLPAMLRSATRSAGQASDPFLPPGYLTPRAVFDVGPASRSADGGAAAQTHPTAADEVLVIELTDGATLVTSAARLKDALLRSRPELIDANGDILFEQMRSDAAGTTSRGLGALVGGLVSKVFAIGVQTGADPIADAARAKLKEWAGGRAVDAAELGVSRLGTKALMWAIEQGLKLPPGLLYAWQGASGSDADLADVDPARLQKAAAEGRPMLVFVHGTGSNTLSSFGELQGGDRGVWAALERRFDGGVYGFEHRTLSESPIENALQLARALPAGAKVNLVSHSRGGLVADLLCLTNFDALIDAFRSDLPGTGDANADEAARVRAGVEEAHAEHRERLRELAALLRTKQLVVQRYVRVASPAKGTLLASGNFDLFLSGILTLIGQVPVFFGSPLYSAFKRVVIDIANNRTNPRLVPGIEAMLPDSPLAPLLQNAPVQPGLQMVAIAGDIEGGNLLKRLGVFLTDFLLYDNVDNDLVVDTPAMLSGIAARAEAKALFDRGADVSHFRYFANIDTRNALRDWLTAPDVAQLAQFQPLPGRFIDMDAQDEAQRLRDVATSRGAPADLPVVVLLPGVMGSHLQVSGGDRVWFDPLDIAAGGLAKIAWGQPGVEAEKLFSLFYGKVCEHLAASHRVETFAYDWRQPLDVLGQRFGDYLEGLLKTTKQPIRLMAHSMGGLVVRACIHERRAVIDELMSRDGARLLMLGTPHQGAHSMVANLLGKGDTLRTLVRLDVKHDMQQVLDIVGGFRGAMQLLPKPGFTDTFQGQPDGGEPHDYQTRATWAALKAQNGDFWFGDGHGAVPDQDALDAAAWLWRADGPATPELPAAYQDKSVYVFGVAANTPCGVRTVGTGPEARLKLVGTTRGDGTVTWDSGRIGYIGAFYYLAAEHGNLLSTTETFPALTELLTVGRTTLLPTTPPAVRAIEQARPTLFDAGPPTVDNGEMLARGLMGGRARTPVPARPKQRIAVAVRGMDLRFLQQPVLVGHYEQDPIAGPERLIDRELLAGDLTQRHDLGLYAGPRGTATVVLRVPNAQERARGSFTGAVVTGLGSYDGALSQSDLTSAVRTGALRYLLQIIDVLGPEPREVRLATLLLGYNSSANITVASSVEALLRGVAEANHEFAATTRLPIRIGRLDIVELYQDTAITAVYALRAMPARLAPMLALLGTEFDVDAELQAGPGLRQRLFDRGSQSYWPRLIVSDAAHEDDATPLPATGRTALANRLRFLYVGQRARAEAVVQQRQPGLIETVVRQQIADPRWNPDFGRMLFQLMVPHDFKDAARQLQRLVLVVDVTTANLPWEMMLAGDPAREGDDRPLALRAPVVRQLASGTFRRQVRQAMRREALVIGNPSVAGFCKAFTPPGAPEYSDPPSLTGAQTEAQGVADVLTGLGYRVEAAIGDHLTASDILALLYRQPWRVLHISAHGVFDLPNADGARRSGVVLSDGLLITAAEIEAMEVVPELVFLNCCHLGQIDLTVRDGNKLAASVARELIEIGVRCVVVSGWAVNDAQAQLFGETFYRGLLQDRLPFGDAVFEARQATWNTRHDDITWGAFQAYGDPLWLDERQGEGGGAAAGASLKFVSPEEALDAIASLRSDVARRTGQWSDREARADVQAVQRLLDDHCPPDWESLPALQSALGAAWCDLGDFERARTAFLRAVQAEDRLGRVPITDLEQLADVETRLGERDGDVALVRLGLERLRRLDQLVAGADGGVPLVPGRCELQGAALKRLAHLHARRLLALAGKDPAGVAEAGHAMMATLVEAVAAYRQAEGVPGQPSFRPYLALNRLAFDALTPWLKPADRDAAIALGQRCVAEASAAFERDPAFTQAVMQPEAMFVLGLLDGSIGAEDGAAWATVSSAYLQALSNITAKPRELDAVLSQMLRLATLLEAVAVVLGAKAAQAKGMGRIADRLRALAETLQPGIITRQVRSPAAPVPALQPKPAAKAKPAIKGKGHVKPAKKGKASRARP